MSLIIKIAAVVLSLILVAGTIWFFLFFWPLIRPTPLPTQNTSNNSPVVQSPTSVVVKPAANTVPIIDTIKAYNVLFTHLGAIKVDFVEVTSASDKQYGSVYALYNTDVAQSKEFFPKAEKYPIEVSLVDLNLDGTQEAVAYESLPGYCGSAGCSLIIYQKQKGSWKPILETLAGETVAISNSSINGFKNILVTLHDQQADHIDQFVWDGSKYKQSQIAAVWNGNDFVLVQ